MTSVTKEGGNGIEIQIFYLKGDTGTKTNPPKI